MRSAVKNIFALFVVCISLTSFADSNTVGKPGPARGVAVEAKYEWNSNTTEKIEALKLRGEINHGRALFVENCMTCHLQNGAGKSDGSFPQLAGQHATVIIKQLSDIRAGLRTNPKMKPHTVMLPTPQDLADVAAYISYMETPRDNGKNSRNTVLLKKGEVLYKKDCLGCHGANGEGSEAKMFPVLAGQHYKYLLRQMKRLRNGERKNGLPEMINVVKKSSDEDLDAISSYSAGLKAPTRIFPAPATK